MAIFKKMEKLVRKTLDTQKAKQESPASFSTVLGNSAKLGKTGSIAKLLAQTKAAAAAAQENRDSNKANPLGVPKGAFARIAQQVAAAKAGNAPVRKAKRSGLLGKMLGKIEAAKKAAPMTPLAAKKGGAITKARAKSMSTKRGK